MGIFVKQYPDVIAFGQGSGGQIRNHAVNVNLSRFLRLNSAEDVRLKKDFFTVIIHGWVNQFGAGDDVSWSVDTLASEIDKYWNRGNARRALLLLSCLSGYGVARPLSRKLKVPVLAPQSFAYINLHGQIMSDYWNDEMRKQAEIPKDSYIIQEQPRWVFVDMEGVITRVSDFPVLMKVIACQMAEKWINKRP